MDIVKPKVPAIRATQPQTDLLKAAYAVSSTPLPPAIRELSAQTGLPEKWINNWFGRQRNKFKKTLGKIPDTGTMVKTEHTEVLLESDPPSSSPRSAGQDLPEPTRKPARRRAPRPKKPKVQNPKTGVKVEPKEFPVPPVASATISLGQPTSLLPSAASSITRDQTVSLEIRHSVNRPALSDITLHAASNSVQSKDPSCPVAKSTEVYSSTGYYSPTESNFHQTNSAYIPRGPIMHTGFRHSFADCYSIDSGTVSLQKGSDLELQLSSSPTSSEAGNSMVTARSGTTTTPTSCYEPAAQQAEQDNPTQQALSTLFNEDPAAYRAMLLPYAILFPTLLPALAGPAATPPSQIAENQNLAGSSTHSFFEDYTSTNVLSTGSPRLPAYAPYNEELPPSSPPIPDNEPPMISWDSDSDYLNFSELSYQDAPLYHLQERLEPFRIPESEYLFGREGVVNYLLDERLAEQDPFHAALGLVLLSKLGLKW